MARLKVYGIARTRAFRALAELMIKAIVIRPALRASTGLPRGEPEWPAAGDRRHGSSCGCWRSTFISLRSAAGFAYPATRRAGKVAQWACGQMMTRDQCLVFHADGCRRRTRSIAAARRLCAAIPCSLNIGRPALSARRRVHRGRPQCRGGCLAVDRDGSVGDAALPRLVTTLL